MLITGERTLVSESDDDAGVSDLDASSVFGELFAFSLLDFGVKKSLIVLEAVLVLDSLVAVNGVAVAFCNFELFKGEDVEGDVPGGASGAFPDVGVLPASS